MDWIRAGRLGPAQPKNIMEHLDLFLQFLVKSICQYLTLIMFVLVVAVKGIEILAILSDKVVKIIKEIEEGKKNDR